jgi:hypothetical protein
MKEEILSQTLYNNEGVDGFGMSRPDIEQYLTEFVNIDKLKFIVYNLNKYNGIYNLNPGYAKKSKIRLCQKIRF